MTSRSKRLAALAAVAVVASMVVPSQMARAQTTYSIDVGAFLPGANCNFETGQGCLPADGMRFYGGPSIKIQSGDVVRFNLMGFHTATLVPKNTDISSWASANTAGIGKPYSLFTTDPDDSALDEGGSAETPSLKANNAALLPSNFACGSEATPCEHDGTAVTNSGVGLEEGAGMSVRFTGNDGDVFWAMCLVHTHMRLRIEIVDSPAEASTQSAIDSAAATQAALDQDEVAAMHEKMKNARSKHRTADGKLVHDVFVGVDNHWTSLLAMYPKKVTVKKGETVRFHFAAAGIYEDHTASFPKSAALEIFGNDFIPACDPDGDGGPGPDNPPDLEGPPFCADPTQLEFDISPLTGFKQGDGSFGGSDFENSGVRGAQIGGQAFWDLKFTKKSGAKPFKYFCMIHGPFMGGSVAVE